jgi:signal transduction histidine kinase
LPLLVLVMLLAIALLLTAIWLFRREHAVMKMRADFVSQVSHELRTPLTQIRMFAETLLLKRTRSEEEQQRSLQIIDRESRRLSHLVENILLFSSISDSLKVDPELQPVAPIVREVCEATSLATPDLNIEVMAEDSVAAIVDDDALRQILLNLLDNAIKYGPQGQQVTVAVSQRDCVARIEVADQGPGIPESERDRVWGAFYRLSKEEQTAISGTGIGLAVVRGLVEAMHGRCWIADSESGARIVVEIPGSSDDD